MSYLQFGFSLKTISISVGYFGENLLDLNVVAKAYCL